MKGCMSLLLLLFKEHFKMIDKGQLLQVIVQKEKEGVWSKEVLLEKDNRKAMAFGVTGKCCCCVSVFRYCFTVIT